MRGPIATGQADDESALDRICQVVDSVAVEVGGGEAGRDTIQDHRRLHREATAAITDPKGGLSEDEIRVLPGLGNADHEV